MNLSTILKLFVYATGILLLYAIMFRKIITPKDPVVTMRLPDEMVGKPVEVIAFEIEAGSTQKMCLQESNASKRL